MAPVLNYTLPVMQLVCNLVVQDTPVLNNTTTGPIVANNSTPHIPSSVFPEGYVPYYDIGVAYKIYNDSYTWKAAREHCISQGAYLAVTDTHIKFEHLMSQAPLNNAIHVGMHRMYDDAEWVSATTGSTITSPPFAPGYPNGVYDCMVAGYNPRGVRNLACTSKANCACEIPIHANYAVLGSDVAKVSVN